MEWIWIADQQTQINALLNGEVDLVEIVPPDLLPLLQKEKNVKIMVTNLAGRQYAMRFNVLWKPFDNAKIRQAVLYALDQKEFLEANASASVRLRDVARSVGASPAYLTDVFRRVEGVPVHRYVMQLRLSRALVELPHANDLTTLAFDLGFSSHSHFTVSFRRAFGCTPSQFREKYTGNTFLKRGR